MSVVSSHLFSRVSISRGRDVETLVETRLIRWRKIVSWFKFSHSTMIVLGRETLALLRNVHSLCRMNSASLVRSVYVRFQDHISGFARIGALAPILFVGLLCWLSIDQLCLLWYSCVGKRKGAGVKNHCLANWASGLSPMFCLDSQTPNVGAPFKYAWWFHQVVLLHSKPSVPQETRRRSPAQSAKLIKSTIVPDADILLPMFLFPTALVAVFALRWFFFTVDINYTIDRLP